MTNTLKAINNLVKLNSDLNLEQLSKLSSNKINSVGDALESFIKDIFSNSLNLNDKEKLIQHSNTFSFLGNKNNPPDIMIRGGDAIEVKKIQSLKSQISLNSSFPKDRLYAKSKMITKSCRECEEWEYKDLVYVIGTVKEHKLTNLWFIYGDCYAASEEVYTRIKRKIEDGITELDNIEFSETKELGRINKVDPLGITYLRIRGMWGIDNPSRVYSYLNLAEGESFSLNAIISKEKFNSFPQEDIFSLRENSELIIDEVKVKSPNNPANLMDCYHIKYEK